LLSPLLMLSSITHKLIRIINLSCKSTSQILVCIFIWQFLPKVLLHYLMWVFGYKVIATNIEENVITKLKLLDYVVSMRFNGLAFKGGIGEVGWVELITKVYQHLMSDFCLRDKQKDKFLVSWMVKDMCSQELYLLVFLVGNHCFFFMYVEKALCWNHTLNLLKDTFRIFVLFMPSQPRIDMNILLVLNIQVLPFTLFHLLHLFKRFHLLNLSIT